MVAHSHDVHLIRWLSKGKKRCPVCRNFFVPGSRVDDKKVITHDEENVIEEAIVEESDGGSENGTEDAAERIRIARQRRASNDVALRNDIEEGP